MNHKALEKLVEKGILDKSDLDSGASLNAEQREAIADLTIDAMGLKDHVTVEKIKDKWEYDYFELTGRHAELDNGLKSGGRKPNTGKIPFNPVDLKTVLRPKRSYLRRLAGRGMTDEQKADALMGALATVMGNDAEKMLYQSNALGNSITESEYQNDGAGSTTNRMKDETFAQFNGIIAKADENGTLIKQVDAANSEDIQAVLFNLFKALDPGYVQKVDELAYYTPFHLATNLRSFLSKRDTQYGDLILTEGGQIRYQGIPLVPLPLFDLYPIVTEHITLNGATAVDLSYKPIPDASSFWANLSTLADTPTAPYIGGTDYTLNTTNGTILRPGSGSAIPATDSILKLTYRTLPQIFLTKKSNFVVAIGINDTEMESQYFANEGVLELVGRTRIAYDFVKKDWAARAYNIKNAIASFTS